MRRESHVAMRGSRCPAVKGVRSIKMLLPHPFTQEKMSRNRGGGRTLGLLGVCPVLQAGRIATTLAVSRDVTGRKAASAAAEALQYALDAKSTTAKE